NGGPINPFDDGSFTIRFHPSAAGMRTATIHVPSDDPTHPSYDFTVAGFGLNSAANGLRYAVSTPGTGLAAQSGFLVAAHYVGNALGNSPPFDSTQGRGPFTFYLGHHQVIPGWEAALAGAQPGEFIPLVIPPELGYGATPQPGIPANSTLVFDIEIV